MGKNSAASFPRPHLAELINDGEITVGGLRPGGGVATAGDPYNPLAMRVRPKGETLFQLLARLDEPIAKANPPPINPKRP